MKRMTLPPNPLVPTHMRVEVGTGQAAALVEGEDTLIAPCLGSSTVMPVRYATGYLSGRTILVELGDRVCPGQHVGFLGESKRTVTGYPVEYCGIIDPFLLTTVGPGERAWLFPYPESYPKPRGEVDLRRSNDYAVKNTYDMFNKEGQ